MYISWKRSYANELMNMNISPTADFGKILVHLNLEAHILDNCDSGF